MILNALSSFFVNRNNVASAVSTMKNEAINLELAAAFIDKNYTAEFEAVLIIRFSAENKCK